MNLTIVAPTHEEGPQQLQLLRAGESKRKDAMNSTSIVQRATDGDLFTTSEAIADGADVEHRAVLQIITKYAVDFERFGGVAFEMRPFETPGGTQHKRVAKLNEHQATLLLTYAKNTERVRRFKSDLVAAFYEMTQQFRAEQQLSPQEQMAQGLLAAQQMLTQKDEQIAELSPKAEAWDSIVGSTGSWSFNDAAKMLHEHGVVSIGERRLFRRLDETGHLYRDNKGRPHVYQRYVDQGLFKEKARYYRDNTTGELCASSAPQVRITGKGLQMLRNLLAPTDMQEAAA